MCSFCYSTDLTLMTNAPDVVRCAKLFKYLGYLLRSGKAVINNNLSIFALDYMSFSIFNARCQLGNASKLCKY